VGQNKIGMVALVDTHKIEDIGSIGWRQEWNGMDQCMFWTDYTE